MENKINIAEILKDCPKGTKLYSPLVGECRFEYIHSELKKILISASDGTTLAFHNNGTYFQMDNSECLLFPSKENRDWSKFQRLFKDGDIVATNGGYFIGIIKVKDNMQVGAYCSFDYRKYFRINVEHYFDRLATEEEKQKLFDTIKANGYKWNEETKTLEKLVEPIFKSGDLIVNKNGLTKPIEITSVGDEFYYPKTIDGVGILAIKYQDDWELVPDQFDITTLKPFDKVLVRDSDKDMWCASIFSHTWRNKYFCIGAWYNQCIPYEVNKELLGTTNNPKEYENE